MNVRDYWISKLSEVRKQSSATGRLVESLLINDSKVARETLVEMAKLNENENSSKEEIDQITKDIKKDLKQTFSQASNSLSQHKPKKEVLKQIINSVKEIENKHKNKLNSKLYILEKFHEQYKNADDVYKQEEEMYDTAGYKDEYNEFKKILVLGLTAAIISIAIAIYFGVLVYRHYKDKSSKIVSIIIGVIAGILAYYVFGAAIGLVFGMLYALVSHVTSLFKRK